MSEKTVTLRQPRRCDGCKEEIKAGEKAIYNRSRQYRWVGDENGHLERLGFKSEWHHPWEMLCHIDEPQRSKCLAGSHDLQPEADPCFDFWEPPTLTGRKFCVCGYSPETIEED